MSSLLLFQLFQNTLPNQINSGMQQQNASGMQANAMRNTINQQGINMQQVCFKKWSSTSFKSLVSCKLGFQLTNMQLHFLPFDNRIIKHISREWSRYCMYGSLLEISQCRTVSFFGGHYELIEVVT